MLLSRIFALLLGTTIFVMIWSMQDGDHLRRMRVEAEAVPSIQQPESTPAPASVTTPVQVTSASVTTAESALWMFADEPAERVAGK